MEITNEIVEAISVLKKAGLKAGFAESSTPDLIRIWGGVETPYPYPPKRPRTKVIKDNFDIVYHHEDWFAAFPAYGAQWIYMKRSKSLSVVVAAVCDYFQMLAARTETTYYRIAHGVYWLQRSGLDTEITSPSDIRAVFEEHKYSIHLGENGWTVREGHPSEDHEELSVKTLREAVEIIIDKHQRIMHPDKLA